MITKILFCFVIIFSGGSMNSKNNANSICDYFSNISNIATYTNEGKSLYFRGDDKFEALLSALKTITDNSHDMPAYGVAQDKDVIEAKKNGTWIELVFDKTEIFNEMPFDALLIEVKSEDSGFNLIRKHNGKYDGRCFYLSLSGNMKPLFDKINEVSRV